MLSKYLGVFVLLSSGLAVAVAFAFGVTTASFDPFSASGSYPCSGDYVDPYCDSPVNGVADVVVSIDSLSMTISQTGTVALRVSAAPEPGLGAWNVAIAFDPTILELESCDAQFGGLCKPDIANSTVRILGASASGLFGSLNLGSLTFVCLADGRSPLEIDATELFDATIGDPQVIYADTVDGEITCSHLPAVQPLVGDASCDGAVNVVDAALVLQFNAGLLGSLPCPQNADENEDGSTDTIDAALILQFSAGLLNMLPP